MSLRQDNKKTFYIENLGCSKNQVDAEIMITKLSDAGWVYTSVPKEAECIIVNTCGFIEPAKKESIDTTLAYRDYYPDKKIIMSGCFAQRYGQTLLDKLEEVDGIFGNHDLNRITEAVDSAFKGVRRALIPAEGDPYPLRTSLLSFRGAVNVKIAEGCNHRCSYCAIPLIRGNLRSRSVENIVNEIKSLVKNGSREINLIAQDLAAFGTDRKRNELLSLLESISLVKGHFWVRLLYIYPDDFPFEVLELIARDKRFIPYFDLPFQHASGKVLALMGRKGNSKKYLELIKTIREKLPDAVIRSTFMLGFPGEGKAEREELFEFLKEASLDWAGFFIYSREEDTPAYNMRGAFLHERAVKAAEKFLPRIENLQESITEKRMERYVGRDLDVLIEEKVTGESLFFGRGYLQAPEVDGNIIVLSDKDRPLGQFIRCKIVRRNAIDLEAVPLDEL